MRKLAWGICAAFSVLLAVTLYVAVRTYEGPLEEDYYRKSLAWFEEPKPVNAAGAAFPPAAANGSRIRFRVDPFPVPAMREIVFTVDIPGDPPDAPPWIDLTMPGMTMPPNRVDLRGSGTGRYRGTGAVVRCPAGGKTWIATVRVPGRDAASFSFDVGN